MIDREDRNRRAVFGAHVAQRRAVGNGQGAEPVAEELDELADDAVLPEHFGDGEHEVGGRRPFRHRAGQPEPEHLRNQHRARLTEHRSLGFDTAHAPPDHAEAIDHRGVRVGADQRVGIGQLDAVDILRDHDAGEVLDVDLVDDAGIRRDDFEIVERALSPAQEGIALAVARELELGVEREGVRTAEVVHLHRVVDDELDRLQRIHTNGISAERDHGIAHGREIDHARHAGKVLEQHTRRHERNLFVGTERRIPLRHGANVVGFHERVVLAAQQILEQDLHRVRQTRDARESSLFERGQAVNIERLIEDPDLGTGTEAVQGRHALR